MKQTPGEYCFNSIGTVQSCYKQKFTIPRQPGLVPQAKASILLDSKYNSEDIVRGLEKYSHIWVIFVFHQSKIGSNKNTVRPPRLGGEQRMGVFATRSNYRPNPIGQSVVKLESVEMTNQQIQINISGADILDGSPVLDIKPYVPYADSVAEAKSSFASAPPEKIFNVSFDKVALEQLQMAEEKNGQSLGLFIENLLAYDPRPANSENKKQYVTRIYDYDLKWHIRNNDLIVTALEKILS